jgi:hypothetical protein
MSISLSQVVSVALSLAIIYYILGMLVSLITKLVLEFLETRGKSMESFLKLNLIGLTEAGKQLTIERLRDMPQLSTLKPVRYAKKGLGFFTGETEIVNLLERVPAKNLVDALFDIAGTTQATKEDLLKVVNLLPDRLPNQSIDFAAKKELKQMIENGFTDIDAVRLKMETWFGGLMDQAAQAFKAQARRWVIFVSILLTVILGVDSIELARRYWNDAAISATANAQASLILASSQDENLQNAQSDALLRQLDEMNALDFEWYFKPADAPPSWLVWKILGLVISAVAVSQGSSFWYDMIRQLKGEHKSTSVPSG